MSKAPELKGQKLQAVQERYQEPVLFQTELLFGKGLQFPQEDVCGGCACPRPRGSIETNSPHPEPVLSPPEQPPTEDRSVSPPSNTVRKTDTRETSVADTLYTQDTLNTKQH